MSEAGSPTDGPPEPHGLPSDPSAWKAYFARFPDIVLVANSDSVDIAGLEAHYGEGTLFVFFNKVYKVLDRPFERPALLVARSSAAGANIVYRKEVASLLPLFDSTTFCGFLNLRASGSEAFSEAPSFGGRPVGHLDLSRHFEGFYSTSHVPSSGFAIAVWMAEQGLKSRIHLAGFTGQRSERWKIFRVHDWTFEQTVQRLLLQAGRIEDASGGRSNEQDALERIARRFPEIERHAVLAAASNVLAERLDQGDAETDELIVVTRFQRRLRAALKRLKPKTRKERMSEERARGEG